MYICNTRGEWRKTCRIQQDTNCDNCSCSLHWRHNGHNSVSNHQPHDCLLNRLFRRRSNIIPKLRVTGLCVGNSPGPVNSPHKGPATRKMFSFDDVIMCNMSQNDVAIGCLMLDKSSLAVCLFFHPYTVHGHWGFLGYSVMYMFDHNDVNASKMFHNPVVRATVWCGKHFLVVTLSCSLGIIELPSPNTRQDHSTKIPPPPPRVIFTAQYSVLSTSRCIRYIFSSQSVNKLTLTTKK